MLFQRRFEQVIYIGGDGASDEGAEIRRVAAVDGTCEPSCQVVRQAVQCIMLSCARAVSSVTLTLFVQALALDWNKCTQPLALRRHGSASYGLLMSNVYPSFTTM